MHEQVHEQNWFVSSASNSKQHDPDFKEMVHFYGSVQELVLRALKFSGALSCMAI